MRRTRLFLDEMVETSLKQAAIWNEVKDDLHKSALSLSGGQQQRVSIARAGYFTRNLVVGRTNGGFGPVSAHAVENTLMQLRDKLTMIIVTHCNGTSITYLQTARRSFMNGDLIEADDTRRCSWILLRRNQDYISGRFG